MYRVHETGIDFTWMDRVQETSNDTRMEEVDLAGYDVIIYDKGVRRMSMVAARVENGTLSIGGLRPDGWEYIICVIPSKGSKILCYFLISNF